MGFLLAAAIGGVIGVGLGAFGAHGLRDRMPAERMAVYQTGVQYQLFHVLALFGVGLFLRTSVGAAQTAALAWAGWLFVLGIFLFSGSLYLLAITGVRKLGAITPIGGLLFLAGWVMVGVAALGHSA